MTVVSKILRMKKNFAARWINYLMTCTLVYYSISLHNVLLLCCRETTRGVHENGDEYDYKIGICTPPSREKPGCAVVQEKRVGSDVHRVCLGQLNATTVIDSELCYS